MNVCVWGVCMCVYVCVYVYIQANVCVYIYMYIDMERVYVTAGANYSVSSAVTLGTR